MFFPRVGAAYESLSAPLAYAVKGAELTAVISGIIDTVE
jgi:hypothetical protein